MIAREQWIWGVDVEKYSIYAAMDLCNAACQSAQLMMCLDAWIWMHVTTIQVQLQMTVYANMQPRSLAAMEYLHLKARQRLILLLVYGHVPITMRTVTVI